MVLSKRKPIPYMLSGKEAKEKCKELDILPPGDKRRMRQPYGSLGMEIPSMEWPTDPYRWIKTMLFCFYSSSRGWLVLMTEMPSAFFKTTIQP